MDSKAGSTLNYTAARTGACQTNALTPAASSAITHAVSSKTGGDAYTYDCNGNTTTRGDQILVYDKENRVTDIYNSNYTKGSVFIYNGDDDMVYSYLYDDSLLQVIETNHVGSYYEEVTIRDDSVSPALITTEWKKYYYAGTNRVAMRENTDNPLYLISDHLGSTSLVIDSLGSEVARQSYLPFGETWGSSTTNLPTTFAYTGQRMFEETELHYYVARWYDSEIGHFIQADTIVPESQGVQAWNRYAYVNYSPLDHIDPTGHWVNLAIGALAGGIVGGITYALTNQGNSFDWEELALATAAGIASGVLISSGIGIIGAVGVGATEIALGSAFVGGGAAMFTTNEFYMFDNNNKFDSLEFSKSAGIALGTGALTSIPGMPPSAIIGIDAVGSGASYWATTDEPTSRGLAGAVIIGGMGGLLDVGVQSYIENEFYRGTSLTGIQLKKNNINLEVTTVASYYRGYNASWEAVSGITSGAISGVFNTLGLKIGLITE